MAGDELESRADGGRRLDRTIAEMEYQLLPAPRDRAAHACALVDDGPSVHGTQPVDDGKAPARDRLGSLDQLSLVCRDRLGVDILGARHPSE
jgi:hypothetical protein